MSVGLSFKNINLKSIFKIKKELALEGAFFY